MAISINYSYDYYLRNIYSSNRAARKAGNRPSMKNKDLVQADSNAMKKITEKLRSIEYSSDNAKEILNDVKLFTETYNNLLESSGSSTSEELTKLKKQITKLTKENRAELEELGFSISASGKLSLDKTKFGKSSPSKIERFFGKNSDYMNTIRSYSIRAKRTARRVIDPMESIEENTKPSTANNPASVSSAQNAALANAELLSSLLENPENGSSFDAKG